MRRHKLKEINLRDEWIFKLVKFIINWLIKKGERKSKENEHEINKRTNQSIWNILRLRVKAELLLQYLDWVIAMATT